MKNKLPFFVLPFFLLLVSCGSDRDAFAPTEWPADLWTLHISGGASNTYMFTGGSIGNVFRMSGGTAGSSGSFTYQKNGANSGILTLDIDGVNDIYQLNFSSDKSGTFNLARSNVTVIPPTIENLSGNFSKGS